MSTDEKVTKDIVQTLEDGKEGFASAADKLADSDSPEMAASFRGFSEQRATFASELRALADAYGDDAAESGSIAGAVQCGWMSLKDALTGSDPKGVVKAAEQGERHAVDEYEKALGEDISAGLKAVLERQLVDVRAAHETVRSYQDA